MNDIPHFSEYAALDTLQRSHSMTDDPRTPKPLPYDRAAYESIPGKPQAYDALLPLHMHPAAEFWSTQSMKPSESLSPFKKRVVDAWRAEQERVYGNVFSARLQAVDNKPAKKDPWPLPSTRDLLKETKDSLYTLLVDTRDDALSKQHLWSDDIVADIAETSTRIEYLTRRIEAIRLISGPSLTYKNSDPNTDSNE